MSQIILLNGCSSSGKTYIARGIQLLSDKPWLLIGLDMMLSMMPDQYVAFGENADEGIMFEPNENEEGPLMEIKMGPYGEKVISAGPKIAKTLCDLGLDIIIDEVLLSDAEIKAYESELAGHALTFIKVDCDLKTLQERELLRRDRSPGLAHAQKLVIDEIDHKYDMVIDSSKQGALECARLIMTFADKNERSHAGFH